MVTDAIHTGIRGQGVAIITFRVCRARNLDGHMGADPGETGVGGKGVVVVTVEFRDTGCRNLGRRAASHGITRGAGGTIRIGGTTDRRLAVSIDANAAAAIGICDTL